jgi:hypothetical protein
MLKNMLAVLNGYFFSPENQVVSHCPDAPAHNDDYFHKKGDIELSSERLQNLKRSSVLGYHYANPIPTSFGKITMKK